MIRTFAYEKDGFVYSVDRMHEYCRNENPTIIYVDIYDIIGRQPLDVSSWYCWEYDPHLGKRLGPKIISDYIVSRNKPIRSELFISHARRVENADLSFPILLDKNNVIIDGNHRITMYHVMLRRGVNVGRIPAVRFNDNLLRSFVIPNTRNDLSWKKFNE